MKKPPPVPVTFGMRDVIIECPQMNVPSVHACNMTCDTDTERLVLILKRRTNYQFVFRLVDVQTSNFFTLRNDAVPTRGNPHKVLLNVSRINVRRHFFTERIIFIWKQLATFSC